MTLRQGLLTRTPKKATVPTVSSTSVATYNHQNKVPPQFGAGVTRRRRTMANEQNHDPLQPTAELSDPHKGVGSRERLELVRTSELKTTGRPRKNVTVMRRRLVMRRLQKRPY